MAKPIRYRSVRRRALLTLATSSTFHAMATGVLIEALCPVTVADESGMVQWQLAKNCIHRQGREGLRSPPRLLLRR